MGKIKVTKRTVIRNKGGRKRGVSRRSARRK